MKYKQQKINELWNIIKEYENSFNTQYKGLKEIEHNNPIKLYKQKYQKGIQEGTISIVTTIIDEVIQQLSSKNIKN